MSWLPGDTAGRFVFEIVTSRPRGPRPLALLGAFENYRTLMAQLAKEYETASKL